MDRLCHKDLVNIYGLLQILMAIFEKCILWVPKKCNSIHDQRRNYPIELFATFSFIQNSYPFPHSLCLTWFLSVTFA